jgi:hypothetical protein
MGEGVVKDEIEAVKWCRKAAEQNNTYAQNDLGLCYADGRGVAKDEVEAMKWYRKAAEQNDAAGQANLGAFYGAGRGVAKDYVEAYKWRLLAAAQGDEFSKEAVPALERVMTREQIAEGQKLAREFKPRKTLSQVDPASPSSTGTGFFITEDGFLVTNEHVVKEAARVRLVTSAGIIAAKVVKVDAANDLALLKAEGRFAALPVVASRAVRLGSTVATVGFPNVGLQGFAPKLARGEIAALSGAQDDARYFQISVGERDRPGRCHRRPADGSWAHGFQNSRVLVVRSIWSAGRRPVRARRARSPENVNYAVKSSFLLSFLESVPEVSAKLKEANTQERKFEDVVKSAEQAAVLVLVY